MRLLPLSRKDYSQKVKVLARCFPALVPLARALLCLDCEGIFVASGQQVCPGCGSTTAWALGRCLQRDAAPVPSRRRGGNPEPTGAQVSSPSR